MCDTMVATPEVTVNGTMMLAKNSDREANEAQNVTWVPPAEHGTEATVQCTYIAIPQVPRTRGMILSRPFWMYGAEMGINDAGVAIGNEAVFTRVKYSKTGLTGMDLIRLALERSSTAREALDVIAALIAEHGQGGNGAMEGKLYYHNSFIIADHSTAWIMETAGKHWVAESVKGTGAISNILSVEENFQLSSPGLEEYALQKGFMKKGETLNFRKHFKDKIYSFFARGDVRRRCSLNNLQSREAIELRDMMNCLRDHNEPEPWVPGKKHMERICLHAGGLISSQSTGSMIAVLKEGAPPLVWFTGTAAPCLSFFKPWCFPPENKFKAPAMAEKREGGEVDLYGTAESMADPKSLWWIGEDIHRLVLPSYSTLAPDIRKERDALEKEVAATLEAAWLEKSTVDLHDLCFRENEFILEKTIQMKDRVAARIKEQPPEPEVPGAFLRRWKKYNRKAAWPGDRFLK